MVVPPMRFRNEGCWSCWTEDTRTQCWGAVQLILGHFLLIELLLTLQLHVWDLCSPLAVIFEMFGFCEVYAHIHTFLWLYSVLGTEVDFGDAAFPILSETFNDQAEIAGFLSQQRESCPDEVLAIIYSSNCWPLWIPNCTLSAFQAAILYRNPQKKHLIKMILWHFLGAQLAGFLGIFWKLYRGGVNKNLTDHI